VNNSNNSNDSSPIDFSGVEPFKPSTNRYSRVMPKSKLPEPKKQFLMIQSLKNELEYHATGFRFRLLELQYVEPTTELDSEIYSETGLNLSDAVNILYKTSWQLSEQLYSFSLSVEYENRIYGGVVLDAITNLGELDREPIEIYRRHTNNIGTDLTGVLDEASLWNLSVIFDACDPDSGTCTAIELDPCRIGDNSNVDYILDYVSDWDLVIED
jgi:hypothetical protein